MTRLVRFSNNAVSRLADNITNASTTISLTPGDGAKFPVISGTQFFMATLIKSTGETEIVKVTARATDTLTVVRAAEPVGATQVAYSFSAGDRIEQRLTAKALSDELDRLDSGANIGATNKTADYTVQAADVSTLIRVDTTAGAITITLPEIASLADDFDIMVAKVTDNANAVNIVRSGSTDLINGATSYPVNNQWQSAWLIADRSTNTWTAINSGAATSSIAVDTFTGDGTAGPYTLSGDPMSKANTSVYLSGVYQQKATYTLAGTSLTMGGNVPVGVTVEVVWSRPLSIGRTGSDLVTYDGGTVQDVLDGAVSKADYVELRAYTGRASRIYITGLLVTAKPAGIAGTFQHDPTDTTSLDNGGTIIVGADGRRWKRDFDGALHVKWFGARGDGTVDDEQIAINNAIMVAHSNGGGEVRVDTGTYRTNGPVVMKSNVSFIGENWGNRASPGEGVVIQKTGPYIGVQVGTGQTVRCDDFKIENIGVDSNGFGGKGWSFEHCHYFSIDNLWAANDTTYGFWFYYTWTGSIGYLHSTNNDINYRIYFQCNTLEIGHLYSSTADNGVTQTGMQIGGLLGVNISRFTHEGTARYPLNILGYTQTLAIENVYMEFDHTVNGVINAIYSNAADDTQTNHAISIKNLMLIANNVTVASPLIYASNSHDGFSVENAYIRLQGSADFSTVPVLKANNSGSNYTARGIYFKQIFIEDSTTGGATTYSAFLQGTKTPDAKISGITSTKAATATFGGANLDPVTGQRSFATLSAVGAVTPRWVGEQLLATKNKRTYIANGLTANDWDRVGSVVELVDDWDFSLNDGSWALGAGWQITGGNLDAIFGGGTGSATQRLDVKVGRRYRVRLNISGYTAGVLTVSFAGVTIGSYSANSTVDTVVIATAIDSFAFSKTNNLSANITYCSVREVDAVSSQVPTGVGSTANRPTLSLIDRGTLYFDSTLAAGGKPIWWTGAAWVDATGTLV